MIKQELKLQKQTHKIVKGVPYSKYVFIIPPDIIKLMGWDDVKKDTEFEAKAHPKTGKLVIEKK